MLRSTPFRLALFICGIVAVAFVVSGLLSWRVMHAEVRELQDIRIATIVEVLADSLEMGEADVVLLAADQLSSPRVDDAPIISILDAGGRLVAGDPLPFAPPPGWSDQHPDRPGGPAFRVLRAALGEATVIVAIETSSVERAMSAMILSTGWAALAALSVALFGGGWAAARVRRRQGELQDVLDRISAGDLSARIPLRARNDDLDDLARGANAAFARLEDAVQAMRQVSDDIAHDLRTPLSRVRFLALDLEAELDDPDAARDRIDRLVSEIDGLTETFASLLRISQIEAGARREKFEEIDLRSVLDAVAETYEAVAEETGHRHDAILPPAPVPLRGDRGLLIQALVNLIENAIRHTPAGTAIRCRVAAGPEPILEVEDDGPGIPEEDHDRVLRRLYRRETSRTTPGSGLGLALVRAVGELHGAELTLASASPGLRVRLRFPTRPAGGGRP